MGRPVLINRGETMKLFGLFLVAFSVEAASTYPRGNRSCDHGRKFLCKYCGESCGQARCPEILNPKSINSQINCPIATGAATAQMIKYGHQCITTVYMVTMTQSVMELATTPIKSF